MDDLTKQQLLEKIRELESRLEESEQLIDAIKAGEVDAFAIGGSGGSEVYTLQSGDYAYRVLIEEFEEGAVNVSEDGLIIYTNAYFCKLLSLSYENVIGHYIFDFVQEESRTEFDRLFQEGLAGKSKGEINLTPDGIVIPVYISLTSLQPKLPSVGIIISDLTRKKEQEAMILKYQADLENKNIALIQSNVELASFAYVASHDLQEPLRKIQSFSTLIAEKESDNLSKSGIDQFQRMQMAAKRMQRLIEDLLSYSRTNTAERTYEDRDLNKLVDEVKRDLREELSLKEAVIETNDMGHANVIPFQIRQLLNNLIGNSLKFASPSRKPVITIHSVVAKGETFDNERLDRNTLYRHIRISDNGIGFEKQYSDKIFELFQRLHGRSQYDGTGIGLAIVKKIVENHRGIITASGELDKGATFDIYLPVETAE